MSKPNDTPGLKPRLEAALHLKPVLEGKPFNPIGADRLAEGRERALANRIVTTALRRHGHISHILSLMLKKGVPSRAGILEAVLRTAIAQLLYMDDVPDHSALHLGVEAARADKRAGRFDKLVNGVLRTVQRDAGRMRDLPSDMLLPGWLADKWRAQLGKGSVERFPEALISGAPLDLTLKAGSDAQLIERLGGKSTLGTSVRLEHRDAAVADLPGFAQGDWWVQDTAAAIPARLVGAKPGERVLDLCAAPGGKTAQLAAAGAKVTALDISADRMVRVEENLARLGFSADLVSGDALAFAPSEKFDAVLLDAPCSSTGTFRRHPEVIWHTSPESIADRVQLQRRLLSHAMTLVKPGGRIVYCVCSLEAEEGEDQLKWALDHLEGISIDPITPAEIDGWDAPVLESGAVRITPALDVPGGAGGRLDGFFIARFTMNNENVLN